MKSFKKPKAQCILAILTLVGCSVKVINNTPSSYAPNSTERYQIKIAAQPGNYVLNESVRAQVIVDGTAYPMVEDPDLKFSTSIPAIGCERSVPYRIKMIFDYESPYRDRYGVEELSPRSTEAPYLLTISRLVEVLPKDEIMIYLDGRTGDYPDDFRKTVTINNGLDHEITVSNIQITGVADPNPLTPQNENCMIGSCSPDSFALVGAMIFPMIIPACSEYGFEVELKNHHEQSQATLVVYSSEGTIEKQLSGKVFW